MLDVVTGKHTVLQDVEGDVLAVTRDVPMVGQSVESRAGTTSFIKRSIQGAESAYMLRLISIMGTHKHLEPEQSTPEEQTRGWIETGDGQTCARPRW